ncbi:hypothetical protein FI667_g11771, partial [Globisporangium splendens]
MRLGSVPHFLWLEPHRANFNETPLSGPILLRLHTVMDLRQQEMDAEDGFSSSFVLYTWWVKLKLPSSHVNLPAKPAVFHEQLSSLRLLGRAPQLQVRVTDMSSSTMRSSEDALYLCETQVVGELPGYAVEALAVKGGCLALQQKMDLAVWKRGGRLVQH